MLQMFVWSLSLYNIIEVKVSFFYAKSRTCSFIVYKDKKATSAIAMKKIPIQYMHDFGNLKIDENDRVHSFVQKPQCIEDVVSEYAVISRLILDDSIFEYIDITNTELKEVDLGNALDLQAKEKLVVAYELTGQWLSVDSPSRYFLSQKKIIHNYI